VKNDKEKKKKKENLCQTLNYRYQGELTYPFDLLISGKKVITDGVTRVACRGFNSRKHTSTQKLLQTRY